MGKRIIIVEDFNTSRQIIKKTLERLRYIVDEAPDGREAMKYFDGSKIDLVVTDYNMPNMDGVELTKYIRNKEEYRYIPILMLSTERDPEKQEKAKEAKITGWIKKPFNIKEFSKIIEKILQ